MISVDVRRLEEENGNLKRELHELSKKMEQGYTIKPKSCQCCKFYIQHYIREDHYINGGGYAPINEGHCVRGVPICKGGKRRTVPDDTCIFFEFGVHR